MECTKKTEAEIDAELKTALKDAPEHLQVKTLVNMAKIGRWDFFNSKLKPGVMNEVFSECNRLGIITEQKITIQ